jgi:deoxyribodipyrimidine photolyase-related protein
MGTFALSDLMTTKPYVAGSAYIDRMSDFCGSCAFDPRKDCPIRSLYWAFLDRHREKLADNPRLSVPLGSSARRSNAQRAADRRVFESVGRELRAGRVLRPVVG